MIRLERIRGQISDGLEDTACVIEPRDGKLRMRAISLSLSLTPFFFIINYFLNFFFPIYYAKPKGIFKKYQLSTHAAQMVV